MPRFDVTVRHPAYLETTILVEAGSPADAGRRALELVEMDQNPSVRCDAAWTPFVWHLGRTDEPYVLRATPREQRPESGGAAP